MERYSRSQVRFGPALLLLMVLLFSVLLTSGCEIGSRSAESGGGSDKQANAAAETGDSDPAGTDQGDDAEPDPETEEKAVPVEVANLATGRIESVLSYSTNLEAEKDVKVFSQAARQVVKLLVEEGDHVRKGQVLVRLMDDEQRNNLALVKSDLAKAEREYERNQRLYKEKLISEQAFNDATWNIEQLKLKVENAERELGYTVVRAPISGTITSRLVKLGDNITVGQHLFDIVDFDSIVARVYVPEKHLPDLRNGLPVRISSPSLGERAYMGTVERISPVVDPKSGTVKLTVALGGQPGLRPGMYVDVDLVTASHEDVVLVPKTAVVYDNDRMFVYKLGEENRARRVLLTPALTDKEFIEPLAGAVDLSAGDPIIVAGQTGLKDGVLVDLPEEMSPVEPEPLTEKSGVAQEDHPAPEADESKPAPAEPAAENDDETADQAVLASAR